MGLGDLSRAIEVALAEMAGITALVSHRFPLHDSPSAFDTLSERSGMKVIVLPDPERVSED
jgi:hypothetical protein